MKTRIDLYHLPVILLVFLVFSTLVLRDGTAMADDATHQPSTLEPKNQQSLLSQYDIVQHPHLQHLFEKYGQDGMMTFEGFEHLLSNLGLGKVHIRDHSLEDHFQKGTFKEFHESHEHSEGVQPSGPHSEEIDNSDQKHGENHDDHIENGQPHDDHVFHNAEEVNHEGHDHDSDVDHGDNDEGDHGGDHDHDDEGHDSDQQDIDDGHHHDERPHKDEDHEEVHNHEDSDETDNHLEDISEDVQDHKETIKEPEYHNHKTSDHKHDSDKDNVTKSFSDQHHKMPNITEHIDSSHERHVEERDEAGEVVRTESELEHTSVTHHAGHVIFSDPDKHRRRRSLPQTEEKCMSAQEILYSYPLKFEPGLTPGDFLQLCPAIVHQIDEHACANFWVGEDELEQRGDLDDHSHEDHLHDSHDDGNNGDHVSHEHDHSVNISQVASESRAFWQIWKIPGKVWGFASLSVTIISLVGLFCVAMVPVMRQIFFHQILQFLVALAVGTLTGDALLHLIPHAISGGHSDESGGHEGHGHNGQVQTQDVGHDHHVAVWKGMVVLGGIYFFFLAERAMGMVTSWKRNRRKSRTAATEVGLELRPGRNALLVGEKLSKYNDQYCSSPDMLIPIRHSREMKRLSMGPCEELEELKILPDMQVEAGDSDMGGHSGHGHSHDVPNTVADMAWMVIMGDGLHNFSDGLAIGAAFASSMTVGLSTSIAVFCHELPHELGDFAVLLKAGMTVKQALFYNMVSSVLCFLGMFLGIALGNIAEASQWIFAMTAGIFIYISLVDMLPEIAPTPDRNSRPCCDLLLQMFGISVGVSIMLVIALYEDKIQITVNGES